jgi:hypothetical protein
MSSPPRLICCIEDCYLVNYWKRMCEKHYRWWRDNGKPMDDEGNYLVPAYLNERRQYKHGQATKKHFAEVRARAALRHQSKRHGRHSRLGRLVKKAIASMYQRLEEEEAQHGR